MGYVTPVDITTSQLVTAAIMNAYWNENVRTLANPLCVRAYHNAAQSIPNGALTVLAFNNERYRVGGMHDTATNNSRFTLPSAGVYHVTFVGEFAVNATGVRQAALRLNGTTYIDAMSTNGNASIGTQVKLSTDYKFAGGDYVEVLVRQDSGGALNLSVAGNYSPEVTARWVAFG